MNSMEIEKIPQKVDHTDKKTLNNLEEMLNALTKESKSSSPGKDKKLGKTHFKVSGSTPIAKRLRKHKKEGIGGMHSKLDEFLKRKENKQDKPFCHKQYKPLNVETQNIESSPKVGSSKEQKRPKNYNETSMKTKDKSAKKRQKNKSNSSTNQTNLDSYLTKAPNTRGKSSRNSKKIMNRTDSSDSCDLPTFKPTKKSKSNKKEKENFDKYGISIPSIDEILRDQADLQKYKTQVEFFKKLCDKDLELPFSIKDLNTNPVGDSLALDCKGLSLKEITEYFRSNIDYIADIFHGRVYNDRHNRYNNVNTKILTHTTKDLSYNTSMIVFTFKQIEHMLYLLEKEFDPNDNKTHYFFQVLLPELCLKIFMDSHEMSYEEAILYLDERPLLGE